MPWGSVESDEAFSRDAVVPNFRVFSMCYLLRSFHWLGKTAFRPIVSIIPLLGPPSDWYVWLSLPLFVAEVTLERCWTL